MAEEVPDAADQLRFGMRELLERQQREGTANILTTTGHNGWPQEVLTRTGIKDLFKFVFEGNVTNAGRGKYYFPAAEAMGYSNTAAVDRMAAIGDVQEDQPADIPIVFIWHPGGYRYHAEVLSVVTDSVWEAGKGSFIEGFHALEKKQNVPIDSQWTTAKRGLRLHDGTLIALYMHDPRAGGRDLPTFEEGIKIPTVRVVDAEHHLRIPRGDIPRESIPSQGNIFKRWFALRS